MHQLGRRSRKETTVMWWSSRWRVLARLFAGVRARSTAVAVLVVAVALAVGATLLIVLLRRALVSTVDDAATTRASEVVAQVRADGRSGLGEYLVENNRGDQQVQVLDDNGNLVASSSAKAHQRAISTLRPAPGQLIREQLSGLPALGEDRPYLVAVRGTTYQGLGYEVAVASPLGTQQETVNTVESYLLVGFPVLLLLVGGATWVLVGRSLAPVERIRARVHGITAAGPDERVPVPSSGDEIARLALTMNEMLDRLHAAQSTQRRFVADASHELRSPLATLMAGLGVAAADPSGRAWQELRTMMESEAGRMQRLVEDLLLLAKADDTGLRLERADVDLDDLLDSEGRRLVMSSQLEVDTDITPVRVSGDPAKLSQVLRNLADNAAREGRKQVRLSLSRQEHSAVIVVEDDGRGIPVEERQRVFERFVRLDESRERGRGGSGLGLAIVAEVVHGHGGTISVSDSPLGGARVELRLPIAPPQALPWQVGRQRRS